MKDPFLFFGATGVLAQDFMALTQERFEFTGVSRHASHDCLADHHVRANVSQCRWPVVLQETFEKYGVPKHIVYAVYNRRQVRATLTATSDLLLDDEITLHVNALMKLVKNLIGVWKAPQDASFTVVSSMGAFRPGRDDLFGYCAAKAAQNAIVENAALLMPGVRVMSLCPPAFPHTVPTRRVSEELLALVKSGVTGQIQKIQ